ncbi:MAG TPA: nicotinate-nucleotide adenylyltransferase [Acidimicrobiia bacterium]
MLAVVRTGILGGTFDPIHIAHLHAAECALYQARLDRVLLMPAGDPWQKLGKRVSAGHHRLEMTRLAIAGVPGLEADDREVRRDGLTYTIETLETFPADEELYLILGSDAAAGLPTWERAADVLDRVSVIVAPRPGTDLSSVARVVPDAIILEMAPLGISGTAIRHAAATGRPYRYLVTEPVHRYIEENRLYTEHDRGDIVGAQPETEESS